MYLNNAGAIGQNGPVAGVDVNFTGALSRFELEIPDDAEGVRFAVKASLTMLDVAPPEVTFPLLAAVYRSAIMTADFGLWLAGPTGTFKTELAALAQQHFGRGMDARHLPGNFASTGNALEMLAFAAKDATLVVDDFAPHGSAQDVARHHSTAERLFRAAGNNQGRNRLRADATLREEKPPRGLILATGEDVPRGQSIRARISIIEITPGVVYLDVLTECQRFASDGLPAGSMGTFVQWLAGRYEAVKNSFREKVHELRSSLITTMPHARTPGIVAELFVGFEIFLEFAVDVGAISDAQERDLKNRCWASLCSMARQQAKHQDSSEPTQRFLTLLRAVIVSRRGHLETFRDGVPPQQASTWGWEPDGNSVLVPKGDCLGWIDGDDLYLEPEACYAAVQRYAHDGDPLVVSSTTLIKRLKEKGLLASVDGNRGTNKVRRTIQGSKLNVIHLRLSALSDGGFSNASGRLMSASANKSAYDCANDNNNLQGDVGFVGSTSGVETRNDSEDSDARYLGEEREAIVTGQSQDNTNRSSGEIAV
jgi:hypothetical protein